MDELKEIFQKNEMQLLDNVVLEQLKETFSDIDLAHKTEDLHIKKDKRQMRMYYAKRTFKLTYLWLSAVIIILLLNGWHAWGFSLTQAELITLLSTTTANILGVLLIIVTYIYR